MEEIKDSMEFNRESRADAKSFFLTLSRFPFIATLMITKGILGYTKGLSIKLQGRYVDIVKAYNEVEFTKLSSRVREKKSMSLIPADI